MRAGTGITAAGLAALGALLALGAAATAQAPTALLQTDRPCYLANQTVRIAGADFDPGASYSVTLDHQVLGGGTVAADGTMSGALSSGTLRAGFASVRHRIQVYDGLRQGRTAYNVSNLFAAFSPTSGDPRKLRVRYSVAGLGIGAPSGSAIWLHYIDPRGHWRHATVIGHTSGPCGNLPAGPRQTLFPFATTQRGTWSLQVDLVAHYSPATRPRIVLHVGLS